MHISHKMYIKKKDPMHNTFAIKQSWIVRNVASIMLNASKKDTTREA